MVKACIGVADDRFQACSFFIRREKTLANSAPRRLVSLKLAQRTPFLK